MDKVPSNGRVEVTKNTKEKKKKRHAIVKFYRFQRFFKSKQCKVKWSSEAPTSAQSRGEWAAVVQGKTTATNPVVEPDLCERWN